MCAFTYVLCIYDICCAKVFRFFQLKFKAAAYFISLLETFV